MIPKIYNGKDRTHFYVDYERGKNGSYFRSGYLDVPPTAFHQGEWFQTAIGRPFMYQFDDTGGPLPLQEVGVSPSGILPLGKLGLHYVVEAGNGRAHLLGSNPAQNSSDTNNGKSFNVAMFAQPINRTNPTDPSKKSKTARESPTITSCSEKICAVQPW